MPVISVIVPVYKVEDYLCRCVDSILGQSFSDFELILVDDGSPDSCGVICDGYAQKDSRVHVIHQKNGGLSAARNAGIDWVFACSDSLWLTFIDSDDWVHPEFLARMYHAAIENQVSVCGCGYARTAGEEPEAEPEQLVPEVWQTEVFYRENLVNATIACAKLYKRSCFEQIRYPVGKIHEDEFVTYRILFQNSRLAFIPAPLYAYYVNPQSITGKGWSPRRLDAWEAFEQQIAFFEERGQAEMVKFRYRGYLENAMVNLHAAEEKPETYKKEIRFMEKRMRSVIRRAWKRDCIRFWIDFDMLYRFSPFLTRLYRLYLEIKK